MDVYISWRLRWSYLKSMKLLRLSEWLWLCYGYVMVKLCSPLFWARQLNPSRLRARQWNSAVSLRPRTGGRGRMPQGNIQSWGEGWEDEDVTNTQESAASTQTRTNGEKKNKMKPTNPNADTYVEKQRLNTYLSQFPANPFVEHPDLTHWGDTLVGHPCLTLLRYTLVRHSCITLWFDTLAGHSCLTLF